MNTNTDDTGPSGVGPHAMKSWREKYEYMNTLFLKQKDDILRLQTEAQKTATEIQGQLAKKNMDTMKLEADKYTLFTDIARLQEELAKKDTECMSLRTSLTELKEKTKEEEVKNTTTEEFLSKECTTHFIILLIVLVSILAMNIVSQKSSLLLLTIDETSLLLPSP